MHQQEVEAEQLAAVDAVKSAQAVLDDPALRNGLDLAAWGKRALLALKRAAAPLAAVHSLRGHCRSQERFGPPLWISDFIWAKFVREQDLVWNTLCLPTDSSLLQNSTATDCILLSLLTVASICLRNISKSVAAEFALERLPGSSDLQKAS